MYTNRIYDDDWQRNTQCHEKGSIRVMALEKETTAETELFGKQSRFFGALTSLLFVHSDRLRHAHFIMSSALRRLAALGPSKLDIITMSLWLDE